tara:strand:- start:1086 stop:1370 length:285 start_codon:yes stop_codon:yes gene_type:complete
MYFDDFETFDISLSSSGHYYHEIDLGDAGEHSTEIDPDDLIDCFDKHLDSVEVTNEEVATKYAQNEHEMIELFRELLKQMTEDILIERLSEATE